MFKLIAVFLFVFLIVFGLIELIRSMSNSARWKLTKTSIYAVSVALIATVLLSIIVFLF